MEPGNFHQAVLKGTVCPYCKSKVKVMTSQEIKQTHVGVEYYFACVHYPTCDSYTIGKTDSFEPLGRLADKPLRLERIRAYKHIGNLKRTYNMLDTNINLELSELLKVPIRYMIIPNLGLDNCKKVTGWAVRKALQLEYEATGVYTNISARRGVDGKQVFKRCVIVENISQYKTLVEFDDGIRMITKQVRVTKR